MVQDIDNKYKVLLKRENLIFDQSYLKEIKAQYDGIRKKYITIIVIGVCLGVAGGVLFILVKKDIMDVAILSPYYPICICFLVIGAYLLIRSIAIMESYELLVENEEYINRLGFKFTKIVRNKTNEL